MNKYAIEHLNDLPYAFPIDKDTLRLRIRVAHDDIDTIKVHFIDRYENGKYQEKTMVFFTSTGLFDFYVVDISLKCNRYRYFFELIGNDGEKIYYNERGFYVDEPSNYDDYGFIFPYIAEVDVYESEEWLKNGIVYQIFPARYAKGNDSIHHDLLPWNSIENVTIDMNFGGDLKGIIDHIPYLKDLGITILYLTPIFKSSSNHKYNIEDYFNVDPDFGSNDELVQLVKLCHKEGIRVILDAVLNHSGYEFFAFQDVIKNQEKSQYKDWFYIHGFPVKKELLNYDCFANNVPDMPKLNYKSDSLKEYFLDFATYWIKLADIDGWRLDVGNEVPHDFWIDFKRSVRKIKKDFIICGEVFNYAGPFLRGNEFDSVMNYMFRYALLNFLSNNKFDAKETINFIENNRTLYNDRINSHLWNLIDSHDTSRFYSDINGDVDLLKIAVVMQFTMIGVPFIYYGSEVGMFGENDPDNRRCMIWDGQDKDILEFYRKIISIRKENKVLIDGNMHVMFASKDVLIYERCLDEEVVRICINKGINDVKIVNADFKMEDLITGKKVEPNDEIIIKGKQSLILKGVNYGKSK